jgi:hypothetical protein
MQYKHTDGTSKTNNIYISKYDLQVDSKSQIKLLKYMLKT